MLHKRELPTAEAEDLRKVYHIKLQLLKELLKNPPERLSSTWFDGLFSQSIKAWFVQRIWVDWSPKKRTQLTKFGNAINALSQKVVNNKAIALQVASALESDATFESQWNTPGFELQFPRLYPDWLEAIVIAVIT